MITSKLEQILGIYPIIRDVVQRFVPEGVLAGEIRSWLALCEIINLSGPQATFWVTVKRFTPFTNKCIQIRL